MSGESGKPSASPSKIEPSLHVSKRPEAGVSGGEVRRLPVKRRKSWIEEMFKMVREAPRLGITPAEVMPVSVLAVQRYLLEDEPRDTVHKPPLYCYDVTISDGVYKEKCFLDPSMNYLVHQNILKVGIEIRIHKVSCFYNQKKVSQGILCIDKVHCGETLDVVSLESPFRNQEHAEKPERPLKGAVGHYLALWNNEDPYGDIWVTNKPATEFDFNNVKLIDLSNLEMTWNSRNNFPPLLVRVFYKSKLRYYGKPDKNMIDPYQTYLEVADSSGMVSVIMWNSLCPEWYKSLQVGLVLLLQDYSVKSCYPYRLQPNPADPQMKIISTIEISLNVRDPTANIMIIPENQLKPELKMPDLTHRFTTRLELNDLPESTMCDVVGVLSYVGRVQRSKKKENHQDYWSYRWIHIVDGTSEQPFIVELFSTSQPEIFETICPMMYLVCTQLKVVRKDAQVPKVLYLTTTNESQVFHFGHKCQHFTQDNKVKNFIEWIKTKSDSEEVKKTTIGGYYPYPPVPETFSKYSLTLKVESLLTAISEVKKVVEELQYREHKRIAIQGIIAAIEYIPYTCPFEISSATETLRRVSQPSTSQAARDESHRETGGVKRHQDDKPTSFQSFPSTSKCERPSKKRKFTQGPSSNLVAVSPAPAERRAYKPHLSRTFQRRDSPCATASEKSKRIIKNRWESQLWKQKRLCLRNHLRYHQVHSESITRKFSLEHVKFLTQQYSSQPSKYVRPEGRSLKLSDFKSARSLGHFEVTILGLKQDTAIDVAFLPMYCPEDVQTSQVDTLLSCMNNSCVYSSEMAVSEKLSDHKALVDDILKAAANLDKNHIIGILDICNLGNNKVEVYLQKIYISK